MTNCIAFLLGSLTSLPALSSFCIFAGIGVLFDFVAELSIFSAFLVFDLKRQEKLKGDCCTLCRCSHKSIFCCRGKFLTNSQRAYIKSKGKEVNDPPQEDKNEEYASATEKFLVKYYSKGLLSTPGRIIVLIAFIAYIAVTAWSITNLKIAFSTRFFVDERYFLDNYFRAQDKYFSNVGQEAEIITQKADYATLETQNTLKEAF